MLLLRVDRIDHTVFIRGSARAARLLISPGVQRLEPDSFPLDAHGLLALKSFDT